jgi:hypothetical protein
VSFRLIRRSCYLKLNLKPLSPIFPTFDSYLYLIPACTHDHQLQHRMSQLWLLASGFQIPSVIKVWQPSRQVLLVLKMPKFLLNVQIVNLPRPIGRYQYSNIVTNNLFKGSTQIKVYSRVMMAARHLGNISPIYSIYLNKRLRSHRKSPSANDNRNSGVVGNMGAAAAQIVN